MLVFKKKTFQPSLLSQVHRGRRIKRSFRRSRKGKGVAATHPSPWPQENELAGDQDVTQPPGRYDSLQSTSSLTPGNTSQQQKVRHS